MFIFVPALLPVSMPPRLTKEEEEEAQQAQQQRRGCRLVAESTRVAYALCFKTNAHPASLKQEKGLTAFTPATAAGQTCIHKSNQPPT